MMTTVLITRPAAACARLVEKLQSRGYFSFVEPLSVILPSKRKKPLAREITGVIVQNSIALAALELRRNECQDILALPCFCRSERLAEAARIFGFNCVEFWESKSDEDAEKFSFVKEKLVENSKILFIGGEEFSLSEEFEKKYKVIPWNIYRKIFISDFSLHLQHRLKEGKINAVLFFSQGTAEHFIRLINKNDMQGCCKDIIAIVSNDVTASMLEKLAWKKIAVAPASTEEAVIMCLQKSCPAV